MDDLSDEELGKRMRELVYNYGMCMLRYEEEGCPYFHLSAEKHKEDYFKLVAENHRRRGGAA
jgi:hypothetical protein